MSGRYAQNNSMSKHFAGKILSANTVFCNPLFYKPPSFSFIQMIERGTESKVIMLFFHQEPFFLCAIFNAPISDDLTSHFRNTGCAMKYENVLWLLTLKISGHITLLYNRIPWVSPQNNILSVRNHSMTIQMQI